MATGGMHFIQKSDDYTAERKLTSNRRRALTLCAALVAGVQHSHLKAEPGPADSHTAWVAEVLKRMQTIKVGMSREVLLKVFTIEGGLSTGLQRTFVSRDCQYFKVDIQFKAVGRPDRDNQGRVTLTEDSRDLIVEISRPYLAFSVMD
jgi:hypothetical protein